MIITRVELNAHTMVHGVRVDTITAHRADIQGWEVQVQGPAVVVYEKSTGARCDIPMTAVKGITSAPPPEPVRVPKPDVTAEKSEEGGPPSGVREKVPEAPKAKAPPRKRGRRKGKGK